MFGLDPRLIAVFCLVFIVMGAFYAYAGYKQLQRDRAEGLKAVWYKQIRILTGAEYILISIVFLLNMGILYKWFPPSLTPVMQPLYTVALIAAAILAGIVIFQTMRNPRRSTLPPRPKAQEPAPEEQKESKLDAMTPDQRAAYIRKRRERRQKSAESRRRRSGKA